MRLVCPNCGSGALLYSGTTTVDGGMTGYGATDQRYTCKACGYTGPLVIDVGKEETGGGRWGSPLTAVLALGFFTTAAYALGASIEWSASFFCVSTAVVLAVYCLFGGAGPDSVENDLRNLDDSGLPKRRL